MKISLEIDDRFATVLNIAAFGTNGVTYAATSYTVDLKQGTDLRIDENGSGWQSNQKEL